MATCIYSLPSENKAATVAPALTGATADSAYPLTNLYDGVPAKPFKTSTSSTVVDIRWDFGSAQRLDLFALLMHNIPAGTAVKFQGNAADTWGAPTVDASVTIATYPNDGVPMPAWVDLTGVSGYSTGGFRYWRVHVPSLAQIVAIGEVYLGSQKHTDIKNFLRPLRLPEQHPGIFRRTAFKNPLRYTLRNRVRTRVLTWRPTNTELALLIALYRDAYGSQRPFLFVLEPSVNDAIMGIFSEDTIDPEQQFENLHRVTLTIEELTFGPPL